MPSVYYCDKPRARKQHKCCECRGTISIGEIYCNHHGVWEGQGQTFKVCVDCESLRAEADGELRSDERTPFGYLHETVFDSDCKELILPYLSICRKRGAAIPEWMIKRKQE